MTEDYIAYDAKTSKEAYISNVCAKMTYEECFLQALDEDDNGLFTGALACIFDVDPRVIGQVYNLDFLYRPDIWTKHGQALNYIQWVSKVEGRYDNIEEVLTYLFSLRNHHREEYEHSKEGLERIHAYVRKVMSLFPGAQDDRSIACLYLEWLGRRFWRDPVRFREDYEGFIPYIVSTIERVRKC